MSRNLARKLSSFSLFACGGLPRESGCASCFAFSLKMPLNVKDELVYWAFDCLK